MDTISLCQLACSDSKIRKIFGGVLSSDCLPLHRNNFTAYIINLDPHTLPGTHWTAVFFNDNGCVYFFDSYGRKPRNKSILKFMKRNANMIFYNKVCVQDLYSVTCGFYCLYFLFCSVRNLKLNHLNENNKKRNEIFIKKFVRKKFNKYPCCYYNYVKSQSCVALINMQSSTTFHH